MSEMLNQLLEPQTAKYLKTRREAKYRVKSLSEACGKDEIFTLRGLPYGRVEELREAGTKELDVHILLAGVVDPDLKDRKLAEAFGGATPAETVKNMLMPGEIEEISRAVERLSGYRAQNIEEIKIAL